MARSQNFKVGLFVISAIGLLVVTVLLVTGIRLAEPVDCYSIRFDESVSGLDPGAAVKYRGVRVGSVQDLSLPEDDFPRVEVWIGLKRGTTVKADTKASLSPVGITGLMFVELTGGSPDAPDLEPGAEIESETSFLHHIIGSTASVAQKVDVLLDNLLVVSNREEFERMKDYLQEMRAALLENSTNLNELLTVSTSAATRMDTVLALSSGILARNEARLERSLAELESGLREMNVLLTRVNEGDMVANLNATVAATRDVMEDMRTLVDSNRRTISETLADLRETSSNMSEFSRLVKEKPSLLIRSTGPEQRRLPGAD